MSDGCSVGIETRGGALFGTGGAPGWTCEGENHEGIRRAASRDPAADGHLLDEREAYNAPDAFP